MYVDFMLFATIALVTGVLILLRIYGYKKKSTAIIEKIVFEVLYEKSDTRFL